MAKDENNRNLQLKADTPISYPTVDVSGGTAMKARPLPPARGLAAAEQQRSNPNLTTPMPRTKAGPTLPRGVSEDQLRRGADGHPWGRGSR